MISNKPATRLVARRNEGRNRLAQIRLEEDDPDVIIRPEVSGIGLLDKVDILKVTQKGEEAARFALPELQRAVAWPNRLKRRLFHQN